MSPRPQNLPDGPPQSQATDKDIYVAASWDEPIGKLKVVNRLILFIDLQRSKTLSPYL